MKILNSIKLYFIPSEKYKGVLPVKIYVMKLFFALMFLFVAKDAWIKLVFHEGEWNAEIAVAWCSIAAYTSLSGIGIFHTLKMLPIMLFMVLYKGLWLYFVAFPLWNAGKLNGSGIEGWAHIFILIIIPLIFIPWKYVFNTYILGYEK